MKNIQISHFLLVLAACMVSTLLINYVNTCSFAHDDLPFLSSYTFKLKEEGRWLNWLLFPLLRQFNGFVCLLVSMACLFYFVCTCVKSISSGVPLIMACVAAIVSPSFTHVLDWPVTVMPMMLLLAAAAYARDKVTKCAFFLIFGILFSGVLQSVYMLLPLLFIDERGKELIKVVAFWIACYIIGFIVSEGLTYAITGQWIELASWREPHYVTDFDSFIINLKNMFSGFNRLMRLHGAWLYGALIVSAVVFVWKNRNAYADCVMLLILFVLVMLSHYAQALPTGILVSTRTTLGVHLGIIVLSAVAFKQWKLVQSFVLIALAAMYFVYSNECLQYHNLCKQRWLDDFKALNVKPHDVTHIVMLSDAKDFAKHEEQYRKSGRFLPQRFNAGGLVQWRCAAHTLGFQHIPNYHMHPKLLKKYNIDVSSLSFKTVGNLEYCIVKDLLFVRYIDTQHK